MDLAELFLTLTEGISDWLTQLVVAVIILLLGAILGRIAKKMTFHALQEIELDALLTSLTNMEIKLEEKISQWIAYIIYFTALIFALNQMGVTVTVFYMLLGALLLFLVVIVLLGIKDFIPNATAGLKVGKQKLFKKGDKVGIGKVEGKIVKVTLLETHIETKNKDLIVIPNQTVMREVIQKKH